MINSCESQLVTFRECIESYIVAIYLTKNHLRKGFGSLMKRHLIQSCKSLNYRHLVAKIFATNTSSIKYNLQLGYTIVGKQKEIGFRNNQWQDIVIMQYLIE